MPLIPETWEAEVGGLQVQSQSHQLRPSLKIKNLKGLGIWFSGGVPVGLIPRSDPSTNSDYCTFQAVALKEN